MVARARLSTHEIVNGMLCKMHMLTSFLCFSESVEYSSTSGLNGDSDI
jgi:hypothetical protein